MAVKIYSEYEEFSYSEKEISEYFEDQEIAEASFDDEELNEHNDYGFGELADTKTSIRDDANYYIVCDIEDEELAEEMANTLGKYTKINIKDLRQVFFYTI